EGESYDAARIESCATPCLTPPATAATAQPLDDQRRNRFQCGQVIARVVTKILRRGRIVRARRSERRGFLAVRIVARGRPPGERRCASALRLIRRGNDRRVGRV